MPVQQNQAVLKQETTSAVAMAGKSERTTTSQSSEEEHAHALDWLEMGRIAFVAVAAAVAWFLGPNLTLTLVLAGVACALIGGFSVFFQRGPHDIYDTMMS